MSDILEKSLDEIIGEERKKGGFPPRRGGFNNRGGRGGSRGARTPYSRGGSQQGKIHKQRPNIHGHGHVRKLNYSSLPRDIASLAGSRPVLRVKNIHPDLNGEDLSKLFGNISPVDFVKFDASNDSNAYVCFHNDNIKNNADAIEKYDGKKAMGKILIVENAVSLADRISSLPVRRETKITPSPFKHHKKPIGAKGGKGRGNKQPSLEDLDSELNAYMNADTDQPSDAMNVD
ncbi:hypothetical protein JA1_001663 [Spathaspora sp. JA1]|nr:hypothetical protein JA1_001663 [Spathaspora sp. JA1]